MSRKDFTVTVLSAGRFDDEIARAFKLHADHYDVIPRSLPEARRLIANHQFDVLIYTDIGMDPHTYTLALSRLAPVQCATVGHPVSSGLDTIDYYISSEDLETPGSEEHYTESLIRLKNLPIHMYRPMAAPRVKKREDFGLSAQDHVYTCLQSLFKFHPDFDEHLGGILRGDPQGILLLSSGRVPIWEHLLRQRFAITLPDVLNRIRFLPLIDTLTYLDLLALSDVQLDTIHFGGGSTSYESFRVGLPIVTQPLLFLRGRFTWAMYKQMDIVDCAANDTQEYVKIAIRLGTDKAYRDEVSRRILAANHVLFENSAGLRELEQFLKQAVANRELE